MFHTDEEKIEKGNTLALEVLKTVEKCRQETMTEEEKAYHLSQIEALARDCVCGQYNEKDDIGILG